MKFQLHPKGRYCKVKRTLRRKSHKTSSLHPDPESKFFVSWKVKKKPILNLLVIFRESQWSIDPDVNDNCFWHLVIGLQLEMIIQCQGRKASLFRAFAASLISPGHVASAVCQEWGRMALQCWKKNTNIQYSLHTFFNLKLNFIKLFWGHI